MPASTWCFSDPEDGRCWGEFWAERLVRSRFAAEAPGADLATMDHLEHLAGSSLSWMGGGCFFVPHCELIYTPRISGGHGPRP